MQYWKKFYNEVSLMTNSTAIFEVSSYPKATCLFSKQDESPLHLHRHLEFACILEGRVEFTINGEKYIFPCKKNIIPL